MEVEVVLGEVREGRDAEAHGVDAVEREAVARHLHHEMGRARVDHLTGEARDVVGLGRRVGRGAGDAGAAEGHRAHHRWPTASRAHRRLEQGGRRGLAVGARDADYLERARRLAVDQLRRFGQGAPRVQRDGHRHGR